MARERIQFQGLPARICWVGLGDRHRLGLAFNEMVAKGELKAPVVIGRDHLDSGSVASPNRETEAMKDGSDAVSDWPLLNALLNTASGATWVSLHHGGGVGMGFSQHAGMVIVADGTPEAAKRARARAVERPGHRRHAPRRCRLRDRHRLRAGARARPAGHSRMSAEASASARPLTGVRVLDFSRVLAGPYCTALLADLGADVIKVEPPAGDDYRHVGPFIDGESALFLGHQPRQAQHRAGSGEAGRSRHRRRLWRHESDVVVENFRPGVADKLGIGWKDCRSINPRLVYASISGFGQDRANLPPARHMTSSCRR